MAYTFSTPLVVSFSGATAAPILYTTTRKLKVVDATAYVTTASGGDAQTCGLQGRGADICATGSWDLGSNGVNKVGRIAKLNDEAAAIVLGGTFGITPAGGSIVVTATVTCIDNT